MAKRSGSQNITNTETSTFVKGLNKDSDPSFVQEGMWTHARNAVNNTVEGDLGTLSNESANYLCSVAGETILNGRKVIVGTIHLYSDKWLIYTAVHVPNQIASVNSEIGLFEEDKCKYRIIVQDPCLNFNELNLITGASREKEDCSWAGYWADGLNPDRYINIGDPQTWPGDNYTWAGNNTYINSAGESLQWPGVDWVQRCKDSTNTYEISPGVWPVGHPVDCITCEDTTALDCDKLRLARLVNTPCLNLSTGKAGGTLRNGSYFATIAYSIKGQKVTDWYSPSNVQPLWYELEPQGALELDIEADTENFDEFILVIVSNINQGAVAKKIGVYSTKTTKVYIDQIKEDLPAIPISELPIQTPVYEKSDQILETNNYLLKVGPTSRFDFNYQPLANLIRAKWVSVEYDERYYADGGYKPSYLRDEVYSFFIRWIYNTGDKSSSYHIPGRPPGYFTPPNGVSTFETQAYTDTNTLFTDPSEQERLFEVYNTANVTSVFDYDQLPDGGVVIARGNMAYWESTEEYPDNQPEVWNSSAHCWTGTTDPNYDLCGKAIRHHKMPDQTTHQNVHHHGKDPNNANKNKIRILGVEFENIIYPKDNEGNDIPGVVGYEILRGSREGNKTIVAKGMLNNLRPYNIKGNAAGNKKGLYPNYPFNTIIPPNPVDNDGPLNNFVGPSFYNPLNEVNDPYVIVTDEDNDRVEMKLQDIPKNITTFHSPDTNFRTPFLSTVELKLYGTVKGISEQYFIEPEQHPKTKLIGNLTLLAAFLGGVAEAVISALGKRTYNLPEPIPTVGYPIGAAGPAATQVGYNVALAAYYNTAGPFSDAFLSIGSPVPNPILTGIDFGYYSAMSGWAGLGVVGPYGPQYTSELAEQYYLPVGLRNVGMLQRMIYYFSEGADLTIRTIYALLPYRQYALQMQAHGFYDIFNTHRTDRRQRFRIEDSFYLKDSLQDVSPYLQGGNPVEYRINNLKRQTAVVLRTVDGTGNNNGPDYILDDIRDQSLITIGTGRGNNLGAGTNLTIDFEDHKTDVFNALIISHYGAIKYRIRNQYGQLDAIKQIPITPCEQTKDTTILTSSLCGLGIKHKKIQRTGIFFNGDTYINRYTEKNNMFFFYDWLYGQPDGMEWNYLLRQMIPRPRFWMNSEKYEISDLANPSNWFTPPSSGTGPLPTNFYKLDNENYDYDNDSPGNYPGVLGVKKSYFYLGCSSVRDFFVESDVIVDFRESGIPIYEKHYDPYGFNNLESLFAMNPETITRGNYYAYDYSLSISKLFTQYFSQGNLQSRYYDPYVAKLCYTYRPDWIIYSLPQQEESSKDSWFVYLANNYKEFKDQISGVKNFAKTGIFITFKNSSPLVFQGVDQLQTDFGTKITIGDGGLFAQTPQSVVISDKPYEYGSSQDSRSVISTPAGMFYISQNQGKIMSYTGSLTEISQNGMKWWFTLFLPFKLLDDFPDYPHTDNPVAGIGCQSIYDNLNSVLYFAKKDYKLKDQYKGQVIYDSATNQFIYRKTRFKFSDTDIRNIFFDDASWTISYDPKNEFWISFHDWHPDLLMPGKNTFLSTKGNGIWKHNYQCDKFCNYYGINYPFEVELPIPTGQTVNTLRSMEYILECYRRAKGNCVDQFHVLDYNFDQAVIYNSEQASGYLNLNLFPKNNITLSLQYPQINGNSIDILCSKEEQKYRFNQFWDITKDRGEFPIGSTYPPTGPVIPGTTILDGPTEAQNIWVTQANGYIRTLNQSNLDYNKPEMQRKKFRHYLNFLTLSKTVSNDTNMIVKIVNSKNTYSPR